MSAVERLAIGIAWGLDAEPGDPPEAFWAIQTPEYRGVLLSGATVLYERLRHFRTTSLDVAAIPPTKGATP